MNILSLSVHEIVTKTPWNFLPREPEKNFITALEISGQAAPVLVRENQGAYELVCGYAVVRAMGALNRPVVCAVTEGGDLKMAELNICSRLSELDDALLAVAARFFREKSGDDGVERLLNLAGIPKKASRAKILLNWLRLPEKMDGYLQAGNMPMAAANVLIRFDPDQLGALDLFFADLGFSKSNGLNFLTWAFETCAARGLSLPELLGDEEFATILKSGLSPKDKVARLCEAMRVKRYPHLSGLEQKFSAIRDDLVSGTGWKLEPASTFETPMVEISARFKDRAGLEKIQASLEQMARSGKWEKLWSVGAGTGEGGDD